MTGTARRRLHAVARLPQSSAALNYADAQHVGQRRSSDGAPFIEHPIEVGWLLYRAGAADHVIAAGVLHDVLEKTTVSAGELRNRFGAPIARLVSAVREDESIRGYRGRKAALRRQAAAAGPEALLIFAADKVSKVRELRSLLAVSGARQTPMRQSFFRPRRLAHLRECLGMLEEQLGEEPLVRQLRIELVGLNADLAARTVSVAA